MNLRTWLWTIGWMAFYCLGEFFSKKWSLAVDRFWVAILAVMSYTACVCFWLPALKSHGSLAVLGCIYAALAAVLTIIVGRCIFAEAVSLRHWIGIGFAFAAVIFLGD